MVGGYPHGQEKRFIFDTYDDFKGLQKQIFDTEKKTYDKKIQMVENEIVVIYKEGSRSHIF